jgi:hypothetical protein
MDEIAPAVLDGEGEHVRPCRGGAMDVVEDGTPLDMSSLVLTRTSSRTDSNRGCPRATHSRVGSRSRNCWSKTM